jgi:hypothetical protein
MSSRHKDAGVPAAKAAADPLRAWRDWFVQNEREWSESLTKLMKEEAVARAVGQQINAALHAQQMMTQGMARPLEMLNLPAREDVVALGERIGRLEDAVARLEAAVVQMRSAAGREPARAPARTRKPPRGAGR